MDEGILKELNEDELKKAFYDKNILDYKSYARVCKYWDKEIGREPVGEVRQGINLV